MQRLRVLVLLAAAAPLCAQPTPIVSRLDTVSVHVDSVETYNSLLRFFSDTLKWPLLYGKPLTEEESKRRNYAGLWAGNIMLELCGPYPDARFDSTIRARLHGLTFRPHRTVDESIAELDSAAIRHKPPFDASGGRLRFVVVDDPAMISPTLGLSIMEVRQSDRPREEQSGRASLTARNGGPLGLRQVDEVHIAFTDGSSLPKWERFLGRRDDCPRFRFVEGQPPALLQLVLRVYSAAKAEAFLKAIEGNRVLIPGVKLVCIE